MKKSGERAAHVSRVLERCTQRVVELLESRVLLSGSHDQDILAAISNALHTGTGALATFNSRLTDATALGRSLPLIGNGLSNFDPGAQLSSILSRVNSGYTSLTQLASAVEGAVGAADGALVSATRDLPDDLELDLSFSTSTSKTLPISAQFGSAFSVSGTVTVNMALSENLTVGAYWDAANSIPVFYVSAPNTNIQLAGSITGTTLAASAHLGFVDLNINAGAANFSPIFSFGLNSPSASDSGSAAGRLTAGQLTSTPLSALVSAKLGQSAPTSLTANISTSLAPTATSVTFSWADINDPSSVSSNLSTDSALAALNNLENISPSTIAAGIQVLVGDLVSSATSGTVGKALAKKLPLINQSVNDVVNFPEFFKTHLTNFTSPTIDASGASIQAFATSGGLLTLLQNIPGVGAANVVMNALGSKLEYTLNLPATIQASYPLSLNVGSAINLNASGTVNVSLATNTHLTFGVDSSTGVFYIDTPSSPVFTANASLSATVNGTASLGFLGVSITNGTVSTNAAVAINLVDPQLDNPATPGQITSTELSSSNLPSLSSLANVVLTGSASALMPLSSTVPGINPVTLSLNWPDVNDASTFTLNTPALTQFLDFNSLSVDSVLGYLKQLPTFLNNLAGSSGIGKDVAFLGSSVGKAISIGNTLQGYLDTLGTINTLQDLQTALGNKLGVGNLTLGISGNEIDFTTKLSQNYTGNANWSFGGSFGSGLVSLQSSGTIPMSATFNAQLKFGINLSPQLNTDATTGNLSDRFFIVSASASNLSSGSSISGGFNVQGTGLSATGTIAFATIGIAGGTVTIAGTDGSGNLVPASNATLSLVVGDGIAGDKLTLTQLLANPSSLFGPISFNGAARAVLPLTGLPAAAGAHPQVQLDWSNLADPSTIAFTPNFDPATLNPLANFDASTFFSGITSLISLVQQWSSQPILQTKIPFLNKPISDVINYVSYVTNILQQIKSSGATTPAALESAVLNSPLAAGFNSTLAEIQKGVNDNINSAQFDYVLKFHDTIGATYPFDFGSSLFSLNGNINVGVTFTTNIEFGFNKTDGFYIVGNNNSSSPQVSLAGSVTGTFDRIGGMFGPIAYGVSGGAANVAFGLGLNLSESSTNGSKIPATDIVTNFGSILHPSATGSGNLTLPLGFRIGSATTGPGVTTTFSASWDPNRTNAIGFGPNDSSDPTDGFGAVNYDIGEFVNSIIGPVLNDIQTYNPIPKSVFETLNAKIPVVNKTVGDVLGDYLNNPGFKLLFKIGDAISGLPTASPGTVNLSSYFTAGAQPNTGDSGGPKGGVPPAGNPTGTPTSGNFGLFSSFTQTLKNNFYLDVPVLDSPAGTIIKILTGKDVDLVTFNPGKVSLTESYNLPEISIPILGLGVVSVNGFVSGSVSATLFANVSLGLSTRGLRGEQIGGGGANLLDGFYIDDSAQYQAGINLAATLNIGGSVSIFGFDAVKLYGELGAFGQFGVHVNDVFYNPATHLPAGIANYAGSGAGDNRVYLDEISYIANNYGPLCAIMPMGEIGLNVGFAAKVDLGLFSVTLFDINSQIILVNYNYPCVPVLANLASIQGNQLVMNTDSSTDGKDISAQIVDDPNTGAPTGVRLIESNGNLIYYQDFTFAQLAAANVHTLVMNGSAGGDTFKIDPDVTKIGPIQNLVFNTGQGNDALDLTNLNSTNSSLIGVTIAGGDGNDTIKGTYAPEVISLGNGANTLFTGTGPALLTEHAGTDTVTSGDGNVTVNGGSGAEKILLGNGNNVVNAGSGSDTIDSGNGNNIIIAGSGADQINVGDGKNLILAGAGTDTIVTGNGDNKIYADATGSSITTGSGQNIIFGGAGNDSITVKGGSNFIAPGAGNNVVNGGSGRTVLEVSGNTNMVLSPGSVSTSSLGTTTFTNIASVALTGGSGDNTFDVSGWNGVPVQITGAGGTDTVIANNDTNFTVSDGALRRGDGVSFSLAGISVANLSGGPSDNSFDLSNWHGSAAITGAGGIDTLVVGNVVAGVLSNSAFTRSGAGSVSLTGITRAQLTTVLAGATSISAAAFTGDVALFGQGGGNTLTGGTGSDYIVGGAGSNTLIANGSTDNQLIGGSGSGDVITGGPGVNLLVGSAGGFDTITTGSGSSRIYTPGGHATINAQTGRAIVYATGTGDTVSSGSATTNQVVHPGDAGTVASDFIAPAEDIWEFPQAPVTAAATLPTGADSAGQWVEYSSSASQGGISNSVGSAIEPSVISTGSGAAAAQYVAWADNRTGVYEIFVARHINGVWQELAGSAHGIGISGALGGRRPSIAVDSSGNPIVAWTVINGSSSDIQVAHYDPTANSGAGGWVAYGTSLGASGISNTGKADNAKIALTTAGPAVAWLDSTSGAANVYVARYSGSAWSAVGSGATSGSGLSTSASAVSQFSLAGSGVELAIAWTQPIGTSSSVYLLHFDGTSWSPINSSKSGTGVSGAGAASMPSVVFFGGKMYVAYAGTVGGTTNIQVVTNGASSWTGVAIDTPASAGSGQVSRGAASSPVLAVNGSAMDLVWVEDRLNATPDQAVAIYANRFTSGAFTRQLPGDASFDGILVRPTSLSSASALALAVDAAGHPFVAWGDTSSGSSQVYGLGDTLEVTKVIYVNDAHTASDSFTTADGASTNDGLTPATPLNSIQAALALAGVGAGTVILVDGGVYTGNVAITSSVNGVMILGAPGSPATITGAVTLTGTSNVTLSGLTFAGGLTISGGGHTELSNDRGGTSTQIAASTGGALHIAGAAVVTVENSAFNGATLTGTTSGISILNSRVTGAGISITGGSTGLIISGNTLAGLNLSAAVQGSVTANNIFGGSLAIFAPFTGPISGNLIHGAQTGVVYAASAQLNNNRIYGNGLGISATLSSASSGLGFVAGSIPNQIFANSVGVNLTGLMQGQHIAFNSVGVTGSGTLGGTSLDAANLIEANGVGVQFTGTVQYNRIGRNARSIAVNSGQLIDHNVIYSSTGANLQTMGATDVRIINDTFYSSTGTNVQIDGGSSNVQVLNSILQTSSGYDLYVDDSSRSGFFSDYNDLYTTGSAKIVHYLVDFTDVLDWQDALNLYDLHSIGTTVVNPTGARPQFVDASLRDFRVFTAAAGLRSTSMTIGAGDPATDLGLPSSYTNLLNNPSFESSLTGWAGSAGSSTKSGGAFDGSLYYTSGAVASGAVQQTINLTTAGFSAAQLDAQNLVVSFGGRIRSASESPADQGQLTLSFFSSTDGTGTALSSTQLSASNVTDRWELVGTRVHVPAGARSIVYKFTTLRQSGSGDDSYLDGAFVYVLSNQVAGSMGASGGTPAEASATGDTRILLQSPDLYVNWELNKPHQILWSTVGGTGAPVQIDLYRDVAGVPTFVAHITTSTSDTGSYIWVPNSGMISYGTTGLRIQVSVVGNSAIYDRSSETFTVPENTTNFYVNDGSTTGDEYTGAAGTNRATGRTPGAPLPLLTTLMREYSLDATSTVYIDTGSYSHFTAVEISGNAVIGSGQGVTIIGAVNHTTGISTLGFSGPAVFDINAGSFVTISHLSVTGGDYGFWVHNLSTNFNGSYLSTTGAGMGGLRLETDATGSTLDHITATNSGGNGVYAGAPLTYLTNSVASGNVGAGFFLQNAGNVIVTGNVGFNNQYGLNISQNTLNGNAIVGTTTYAAGLGNLFYNNSNIGIVANSNYGLTIAGNTVFGQTASGDYGIYSGGTSVVTGNVVYNNYEGISTNGGTASNNRVYSNSDFGIQLGGGAAAIGNVVYGNTVGIKVPNYNGASLIENNLVYNNSTQGIWILGGIGMQVINNTVYQTTGNALRFDPYFGNGANNNIENNILVVQGSGYAISIDPAEESGLHSDYNDFYVTGSAQVGLWENVSRAGLQSWQFATAQDAHSISTDPLFVNIAGADFHEKSTTGSYHGGSLAPVLGAGGLPISAPGTLTSDAAESPAIDRGDGAYSFSNEPSPNGAHINLGAYGNTAQASQSPTSYVLVLSPPTGGAIIEGQTFTITWRSQDTTGTANIDLLQQGNPTPVLSIASGVTNSGTYSWSVPTSLAVGSNYIIRVTRNSSAASGVTGNFSINGQTHTYYVNDSTVGTGDLTTAVGSDANTGLDAAHPKGSVQAILSAYTLGAGDIIKVDRGIYNLSTNIVIGAADAGVTIQGYTSTTNASQYPTNVAGSAPASYYRLNDASGTTAADSSGNGLSGTYVNGPTLGQPGAFGIGDKSANFNGTQYVQLPSGQSNFANGFSFEVWAYPTANANSAPFFDIASADGTNQVVFRRNGGGNTLTLSGSTGEVNAVDALQPNVWQFLAVTISSTGTVSIYRNGVLMASGTIGVPANVSRPNAYLGRPNNPSASYYVGRMQEAAIFGREESALEIQSRFLLTSTLPVFSRGNRGGGADVFDIQANNVKIDHLGIANADIGVNVASGVTGFTLSNSDVSTLQSIGVNLPSGNEGATISNNSVHNVNGYYAIFFSSATVTISGNTVYNNGTDGISGYSGQNTLITGNTVYGNYEGINVSAATISQNIVYGNVNYGINAVASTVVTGNTVFNNIGGPYGAGILVQSGTATGNIAYGNGWGIFGANQLGTASNNLVYGNVNGGLYADNGTLFTGNVSHDNGGFGITVSAVSYGVYGNTVSNNVVYGNVAGGIQLLGGLGTYLLNNTVYQTTGDALVISNSATDIRIRNNILWATNGIDLNISAASQPAIASDYNDFYFTGSGVLGSSNATSYLTIADWINATGLDTHSISADPQFVSLAGFDFHEQSTFGSYHDGSLAVVLNPSTNLPVSAVSTLTMDSHQSPVIDAGSPADSTAAEPTPNGGYINLGAYGGSSQASLSPAHYLTVLNPHSTQTIATGQTFTIGWRTQDPSGTVKIDLLDSSNNIVQAISSAAPNTGAFSWSVATALSSGNYSIRITRSDGNGTGTGTAFAIAGSTGIYYVNDSSVQSGDWTTAAGNNANTGLDPAHPKASISAVLAAYQLSPGNTIMVDRGTYTLTANILLSAANSGIIIQGFNAASTVLNRANTNPGAYGFDVEGATNVTLQNLTISGANTGIVLGDNSGSTGLTISNVVITLFYQQGVYAGIGDNNTTITGSLIHDGSSPGVGYYGIYSNSAQLNVTNNSIYNSAVDLIHIGTGAHSVVSGNTLYGGSQYGIYGDTFTVTNNTVYNCGGAGIFVYNYTTVSGNTSYNNFGNGYYQAGIVIDASSTATNNTVYGNVVGINSSGYTSGNRIFNNSQYGINNQYGAVATGNTIYSNGGGIYGQGIQTISNNLIYGNALYGIDLYGVNYGTVKSNTIYQPTGDGILTTPYYYVPAINITVNDNIIWTQSGRDLNVNDAVSANFFSDYNDLYVTGNGFVGTLSGQDFATLAAWTTELGRDRNSISADPKFVNATGADGLLGYTSGANHGIDDDFRVQSTSPTIDAAELGLAYTNEPTPNGGRANLGHTGNTPQAAVSVAQAIQVLSPGLRLQPGQTLPITWNSTGLTDPNPNSAYTSTILPQHPLVYLKLDDTSGTTAVDSSGNGLNGVYSNSPTLGATSVFGAGNGSAVAFNGGINAITVTSPALDLTRTVTMSAWINPSTLAPDYQVIFYKGGGDYPTRTYTMFLNTAGFLLLSSWDGTGDRYLYTQNGVIKPNVWTHVAVVMDRINGTAAIYVNGALATPQGGNGFGKVDAVDSVSQPLYIGYSPEQNGAFRFNGSIDEAAVFGTALNATDISAQYLASRGTFHVDLLNSSNAVVQSIATNIHGSAYNNWTIPSSLAAGTYHLRVTSDLSGAVSGVSPNFSVVAAGTDYYVNDNSIAGDVIDTAVGNNANDGKSPSTPMASIEAVLNTYHPGAGATIHVENGSYTLFQNILIYAADSGVVIQGPTQVGKAAVINRNNLGAYPITFEDGAHNVTIDHLSLTGGSIAIYVPDEATGVKNITISNNNLYNNASEGIAIGTNDSGWNIVGNSIHDNTGQYPNIGINIYNAIANILNNTIYNESTYGILYNAGIAGGVISGNTVYASYVGIFAYGSTITGNIVHDNSAVGLVVNSSSVASGNIAYRNSIGIQNSGGDVRGNSVYGNSNGIYIRNSDHGITENNRIYSNTNYGIFFDAGGYNQIINNLIYANTNGGLYITGSYAGNSILNNTIYQPVNDAIYISGSTGNLVENNILWVEAGYDLEIAPDSQPGFVSDYNVPHHGAGSNARIGYWNSATAAQLSDWQTASGQDAHSTAADPVFVNPSGIDAVQGYNAAANNGNGYDGGADDNFLLSASSPAIHTGNAAVAPSTDLLGQSRTVPTGPVDMGAYVFTGSITDTTPPTIVGTTPAGINSSSTATSVSSIVVTFSEPVNPVDAGAVAEYDLRSTGPDGLFNTTDDVVYPITPFYTPGSAMVTLNFAAGTLPTGNYRFQILSAGNATIHDLAGLSLDGDGNGSVGGTYSRFFSVANSSPLTLTTPVQYIKLDADGVHIDAYNNSNGTGAFQQYLKSAISTLTVNQTASATTPFVIDLSAGNPLPSTGLTFTGNGVAGLEIIGSATASDSIAYTVAQMALDGMAISLTTSGPVSFRPGAGSDAIAVNGGTLTIAPSIGSAITPATFSSISVASGATLTIAPGTSHASRYVLMVDSLTLGGSVGAWTGTLDLNDNDLLVHTGTLSTLANQVAAGALITGAGISSTTARQNPSHLTTLGAISNAGLVFGSFDNQPAVANDLLVKFTYFGDANLDGKIDGSDYSRIDNAFLADKINPNAATGWFNGDFNNDGTINGSDYTLIDNAFNSQGASMAAQMALPSAVSVLQSLSVATPTDGYLSGPTAAGPLKSKTFKEAAPVVATANDKDSVSIFSSREILPLTLIERLLARKDQDAGDAIDRLGANY